jgi:hypothetical protein
VTLGQRGPDRLARVARGRECPLRTVQGGGSAQGVEPDYEILLHRLRGGGAALEALADLIGLGAISGLREVAFRDAGQGYEGVAAMLAVGGCAVLCEVAAREPVDTGPGVGCDFRRAPPPSSRMCTRSSRSFGSSTGQVSGTVISGSSSGVLSVVLSGRSMPSDAPAEIGVQLARYAAALGLANLL